MTEVLRFAEELMRHVRDPAIASCDLPLAWDGHDLAELGRREMAGWLLGEDGWRARFSTQRHVDT